MTADVGHGRRSRRAGAKRRAPSAAIAAGALAAASIPLWPSGANAGPGIGPDQFKSATQTVTVEGVPCTFDARSFRFGEAVLASTSVTDRPECWSRLTAEVTYVTQQGETRRIHALGGDPYVEVSADGARELTRSVHGAYFYRCQCEKSIVLNYSSK